MEEEAEEVLEKDGVVAVKVMVVVIMAKVRSETIFTHQFLIKFFHIDKLEKAVLVKNCSKEQQLVLVHMESTSWVNYQQGLMAMALVGMELMIGIIGRKPMACCAEKIAIVVGLIVICIVKIMNWISALM